MSNMTKDDIRELAERDLYTFAVLVNPTRLYGEVHREVFKWLEQDSLAQLALLPRAHMKSHCIAIWAAWKITKEPWTSIIYVSATEALSLQQLYAIKMVLESKVYRRYWPDMVHPDEHKREKWSASEIKVDSPVRKHHGVRDPTVLAKSVGSNSTGLHCDILVLDDIVVPDNAYTEVGRAEVARSFSQFNSVLVPGGITKAVGTRYHPKDVYSMWAEAEAETFDEGGNITGSEKTWEVFERAVEEDGTFLWPRELHAHTKKWYGFNIQVLAKIRSAYFSMGEQGQYFAQYYNNPNHSSANRVDGEFQYYARERLTNTGGLWYYAGEVLSVFAAGDFAFTTNTRSDYTAIAVVGVTKHGFFYILDLHQYKTDKYDVHYAEIVKLHRKWGFRKIVLEVVAGANLIAQAVKDEVRKNGLSLSITAKNVNKGGSKTERTAMVLEPKYANKDVFHYRGGYTNEYEEQLLLAKPAHDDLRDAVTMAIEVARPPAGRDTKQRDKVVHIHTRFGGRRR